MEGKGKGSKVAAAENAWRTQIEDAPFNDDKWQAKVVLIDAAGSSHDQLYLTKFESFAVYEKRFVIKNIAKSETMFMINQLGAEKKTKDESFRVFEEGQAYLRDKKDVPSDVLALVIKHLMLKLKNEYLLIKKQRLEVLKGLRRESETMIGREEVRGTASKPPEPAPPPPVTKGKGKKEELPQEPEPVEGKKYNTVLRERGEEWRDRIYVDDFPLDGPNIYIAISGFKDPFLPESLIKIGIPITAIVQIRIEVLHDNLPGSYIRSSKKRLSESDLMTELYTNYWEGIQTARIETETVDFFKDTAFIVYRPPYWEQDSLSSDPEKIYDELSFLMYDVQDLSRQHQHFLDNMEVKMIPESDRNESDYKYYFNQIRDLPLECVTIFSLLDCILRTASKENLDDTPITTPTLHSTENVTPVEKYSGDKIKKAKTLVRNMFSSLCKTDAEKMKYRLTYGEEYETHRDPIMIKYGDFVKYPTFHLKNINLDNVVGSVLFGMPLHKLWLLQKPIKEEIQVKISVHVNILLSCFEREDVETAELERLLHILAFRKLYNNRSSLKKGQINPKTLQEFKKVYLKRSILAEPLLKNNSSHGTRSPSFPSMTKWSNTTPQEIEEEQDDVRKTSSETIRINSLFECPDISELVSAAELANNQPINHMIDDFEFFEDFHGICASQILLDAFNQFNCVDYKYCEVTDCIIMMFFNSHDKDGIARAEWRCQIPTPLCLQDFFDFVLEEQYDWVQNEETIYDASSGLGKPTVSKIAAEDVGIISCIEETDIEMIMEGSIKHQAILELEENEADRSEQSEGRTTTTNGKNSANISRAMSGSKSSKFTSNGSNIFKESSEEGTDIREKPFIGYNISDRRVEVFGKDAVYFSRDRTRLKTFYCLTIPYNVEYVTLNVIPGAANNEFWVHKALGNFITPEVMSRCQSFRVDTKDHVMINIKKQFYQVPIPNPLTPLDSSPKLATQAKKPSASASFKLGTSPSKQEKRKSVPIVEEEPEPQMETKHYFSLCITWPNGLIIESVHVDSSSDISHIKIYKLEPLPNDDEDFRCMSLNGEVVIFKKSGDIEVLCPDGRWFSITRYEKRVVEPVGLNVFDIGKTTQKGKEKGKDKGKNKKEPKLEVKEEPLEYELCIYEFELIESNGLKQRWVEGFLFDVEKLLIKTATDYCLGEIFSKRNDGTHSFFNKDGIQVVTFPDNTRIITYFEVESEEIYPEWTDEEKEFLEMLNSLDADSKSVASQKSYQSASVVSSMSKKLDEEETKQKERTDGYISVQIKFTLEHPNFPTVTFNKGNGDISIDSPNDSTVTVDTKNHFKFSLDGNTTANFDGESLNIVYEACPKCKSYTSCNIRIEEKNDEELLQSLDPINATLPTENLWAKMKDSFCKKVVVTREGNISMLDEVCSSVFVSGAEEQAPNPAAEETILHNEEIIDATEHDDTKGDWKSESSLTSHGKCREMYQAKDVRFIVMRPDLTCSELIHRALLEEYKKECLWQPWCYVNQYETFGDHRLLHSILSPINITETEKWMMNSKLFNKPTNLYYKDLNEDTGKGWYHWMRPYDRFIAQPIKPEPIRAHKQPRAFVLRTLEQQWHEEQREKLKGGKELLNAILRYRRFIESESETLLHIPIIDMRLEDEREAYQNVQNLARKIYKQLKEAAEKDVQTRAKIDITAKAPLPPEEQSVVGELEEDEIDLDKFLDEEQATMVKEVEEASPINPNLARYWRRRAAELEEEQFYLYLLREGTVPKYFHNLLGGAFWWEMNDLANEAIRTAQRRKMKCVCESATTSKSGQPEKPDI